MNRRIGSAGPRRVPEPVPAAPYRVPQVLGQVFQRRQRREQRRLLTAGQARHRFGDHRASLGRDPLVGAAALRRDLDPGRAEIIGVAQPLEQAVFIELADDSGEHRRVDALEFGEFGQAERPAHRGDAQYRGLGRGQPFLPGRGVELPRELQDDTPQADDRVTVHARYSSLNCLRASIMKGHAGNSCLAGRNGSRSAGSRQTGRPRPTGRRRPVRNSPPVAGAGQPVARMTSDALITAVTSEPTDRPSSWTASTVIEATRRVPPASSSTLAMASPLWMAVTRAGIWLRALSRMAVTPWSCV